jgi:hypothetical protein
VAPVTATAFMVHGFEALPQVARDEQPPFRYEIRRNNRNWLSTY